MIYLLLVKGLTQGKERIFYFWLYTLTFAYFLNLLINMFQEIKITIKKVQTLFNPF